MRSQRELLYAALRRLNSDLRCLVPETFPMTEDEETRLTTIRNTVDGLLGTYHDLGAKAVKRFRKMKRSLRFKERS